MESHLKALAVLHIVLSSLGVLAAGVVLLLFGGLAAGAGISDHTGDGTLGIAALGGIGMIIFVVVLGVSLPGSIGGIGLLKLAPWSRILMIVISAIGLVNIPFGTALGIYGLWVLTKPETEALLARRGNLPVAY